MRSAPFLILALVACDDGGESTPTTDGTPDAADAVDATPDPPDAPPAVDAADAALDAAPDAAVGCPVVVGALEAHAVGDWSVEVDPASGAWAVRPPQGGAAVLRSPAPCPEGSWLSPVRVAEGSPGLETSFGGFRIGLESRTSQLQWRGPAFTEVRVGEGVEVDYEGVVVAFRAEGGRLLVQLEGEGADASELSFDCGADEGFFGLGTQVVGLNLRGRTYPLWTQEQGIGKPEGGAGFPIANIPEAAYAPMGVWHSSAGYAALLTHDHFSELDLCKTHPDRVALRSLREAPGVVLVPGATPKERMSALTELTGRLPVDPPDWVFGPWNDAVGGPERLLEVSELLRERDIPSSAIWSEDWIGGSEVGTGFRLSYAWEWDRGQYPDLPSDIERLHAQGYAFLGYFNPFVPDNTRMWTEGVEGGFLVHDAAGEVHSEPDPAFRNAGLVDLTNPEALAWLRGYQDTAAAELGIDGWMADFAEWLPVSAQMHSGEDGWALHNRYPVLWQQANLEALRAAHAEGEEPENNFSFFARSGWASANGGTPGTAATMWGGDQNTTFGRDDGLPTVIHIGAHAGLAGVAIFGSDIAGYSAFTNDPTNKELFFRWTTLGAFHPLMRTHHGSSECDNWSLERDAESSAHFRRWAKVHSRLLPYLRGLSDEALSTGVPITRHPFLVAPAREALWREGEDVFFLGDDLYVAPVVEAEAAGRSVILPGVGWWPLFGASPVEAERVEAEAGPTEIPVYVRPGRALTLLERAPDSFYGSSVEGVSDLGDVPARTLALYPDAEGAVAGDGLTGAGWQAPDWAAARFAGEVLPECGEGVEGSCRVADGARVIGAGELQAGDASLQIMGPGERWVFVGGAAWGGLAQPTELSDLNPDVPPPCHE